jgi:hypothetical protein
MSLQVEPPCGFGRTPPVHCHRDQVAPVLDVADDDLSRQPGASARSGEPQRPPTVRLWPPQTQSAARRPHQRAMPMPEQHDEPPRRQPGVPPTRSGCPYLTNSRHNQSVTCPVTPKQGPKATTYQAHRPENPTHDRAPTIHPSTEVREHRAQQNRIRNQAGDAWQDNEPMFPSRSGRLLTPRTSGAPYARSPEQRASIPLTGRPAKCGTVLSRCCGDAGRRP